MTTKKNLVKSMLMSIATAGIFSFGFSSCNDDINEFDNHGFNAEINSFELQNLEQYSYTVPVQIDCQGAWKIDLKFSDENNHFCYALPSEGVGPQTIKLCMLDNWTDERNDGVMNIIDVQNPTNSKSFNLSQKCNLDRRALTRGDDESSDSEDRVGDIAYAVGYGYNLISEPGVKSVSRCPIIALEKLKEAGNGFGRQLNGVSSSSYSETYAENTIDEIITKMSIESKVSGSKCGFSAEVGGSFTSSQKKSKNHFFVMGTHDISVRNVVLVGPSTAQLKDFMTDNAKADIEGSNGLYPSTQEGFKKLIENYGTHLILQAELGGRLRYATTVDKTLASSTTEAKAYANASYKNKIVSGEVKASAEQQKKYEKNESKVITNVTTLGGDFAIASQIDGQGNDNDTKINDWKKSLSEFKNLMMVGINNELVPIYELIEDPDRAADLKEYIETGLVADAEEIYYTTDLTHIVIPSLEKLTDTREKITSGLFKGGWRTTYPTQVYDVIENGEIVAMICHEFIPKITIEDRVTTIYPVRNNKADFSNGYFLGTDKKQACKIHWDSEGNVKFSNYAKNKGRLNEMFIRNGELSTREANQRNIAKADITEAEVKEKKVMMRTLPSGLVKIGTKIWSRDDFSFETTSPYIKDDFYITPKAIEKGDVKTPKGWKLASSDDFEMMQTLLSAKGEQDYTKYLYGWDSKTGFKAEAGGDWNFLFSLGIYYSSKPDPKWQRIDSSYDPNLWYLTSDKKFVRMLENDVIELGTDPIKYAGENKANPDYVGTRTRIVME
jgi:hypothetical protein